MANIATVLVKVPVIQQNNTLYLQDGQLVPQILNVPCRDVFVDTPDYWAVPVKDSGVFTTLQFIPKTDAYGNGVDQPTFDSFTVTRVRDKDSRNTWWVVVDADASPPVGFMDVCTTCCGESAVTLSGDVPLIAPCQEICDSVDEEGNFISIFGAPSLAEGESYMAHGSYNNEDLGQITGGDMAAFIMNLNGGWGTLGSPGVTFVWSNTGTTITATGGNENDSLCVLIGVFID